MPDTILHNGRLLTQDSYFEGATALAVRGNRITAVGSDAEIRALSKPYTRLLNLGGRRVLPGLTDSHFHLYGMAQLSLGADLMGSASLEEARGRVREKVDVAGPGAWVTGRGWNQTEWPAPVLPSRADLDDIAPENPVILWRSDGHTAWANSRALEAAGITADTPDPEAGVIDRDGAGQPTGILRDLAIELVRNVIPPYKEEEMEEAIQEAISGAHRLGLTGVHDMRIMGGENGPPAFRAYQRLRDDGALRLRVWMMLPVERLDEAIGLGLRTNFGDDYLRVGGVKIFADGSAGSRTAWMLEPFEDGGTGIPLTPVEEMRRAISRAHRAGISVAVHAIGDRAIRELLGIFESVLLSGDEVRTPPLAPHRIEHVQHPKPEDLKRLAPLGLVASVQPVHLADDMVMVDRAIGARARWTYAFRSLLDAGTVLALGSDCPVASPNPFLGIHAAVMRRRLDGTPEGGWYPEERITVEEAIRGYTMGAAHACGLTGWLGSITPGKLADIVALDRDILAIPPDRADEIARTRVDMTMFDGEIVYRSDAFEG